MNPIERSLQMAGARTNRSMRGGVKKEEVQDNHTEGDEFGGKWFDEFEDETGIERKENTSVDNGVVELGEREFLNMECLGGWKFDEGSGNVATDSSVHQNNGEIFNGPAWVGGVNGSALQLDGSNDYVRVEDDNSLDFGHLQNFTLISWFKTSIDHIGTLVYKVNGHPYYGYYLSVVSGDKIQFAIFNNDNPLYIEVNQRYDDNNWHMMAGVRKGSEIRLFFDGNLARAQQATGNTLANNHPLYFGQNRIGGFRFNGLLDEISMYDEALGDDEIGWLYSNPGASINSSRGKLISGTVVSKNITIPENMTWNNFQGNRSVPDNTYLNISIHDAITDDILIQNTGNSDEVSIDLSSIDEEEHNTIYLAASFQSNITHTPILDNWSVSWSIKTIIQSPALIQSIPQEIYVTEDTLVDDLVDLSQYFWDSYSGIAPSSYAIEYNSDSDNIMLELSGSNLSVTYLTANWTGKTSAIVSCANIHNRSTSSNLFNISIRPINDLPVWHSAPPALTLEEDINYTSDYSLNDYIVDAEDNDIEFSPTPADNNISVQLEDGNHFKVIPKPDYFGESYIVVSAREQDNQSQRMNNITIPITVLSINDHPRAEIVSPSNDSTSLENRITLSWKGIDIDTSVNNLTFDLYLGKSIVPPMHSSDIKGDNITLENLEDGAKYYWYVVPFDGEDHGSCINGIWNFNINSKVILPEIEMGYPLNNSIVNTKSVNLTWSLLDFLGYNRTSHLFVGETKGDLLELPPSDDLSYCLRNLTDNTTYYWKIEMDLEGIEGRIESEIRQFTVQFGFTPTHKIEMYFDNTSVSVTRGDSAIVGLKIRNLGNMGEDILLDEVGDLKEYVHHDDKIELGVDVEKTIYVHISAESKLELKTYNLTMEALFSGERITASMNVIVIDEKDVIEEGVIEKDQSLMRWFWFVIGAILILIIAALLIFIILLKKKKPDDEGETIEAEIEARTPTGITQADIELLAINGSGQPGVPPFQGRLAEMPLQYKLPSQQTYQHKALAPHVTMPQLNVTGTVQMEMNALPQTTNPPPVVPAIPVPIVSLPLTPLRTAGAEVPTVPVLPMKSTVPGMPIPSTPIPPPSVETTEPPKPSEFPAPPETSPTPSLATGLFPGAAPPPPLPSLPEAPLPPWEVLK